MGEPVRTLKAGDYVYARPCGVTIEWFSGSLALGHCDHCQGMEHVIDGEGTPTEVEFDAMLRQRTTEPDVRAMMSALREQFDYGEDPESFRWLVIDATRIVDGVRCGRECHPDWVPDDRAYILDAMVDSARWDPDEPEPVAILDALEAVLADG